MLFDAALSAWGYELLFDALGKLPEYGDPVNFDITEFSAKNNADWRDYTVRYTDICNLPSEQVMQRWNDTSELLRAALMKLLQEAGGTIVLGTLRLNVYMRDTGTVHIGLAWIERKNKGE